MEIMQMAMNALGLAQTNGPNGIVLAISAVFGVLSLLYGYRLIRAIIFVVGFIGASWIASLFVDQPVALVIGLIVGALLVVFWYLGIFVIGAVLGAVAAVLLGANHTIVVCVFALIGGGLAVSIRKFFLILSTSFYGGSVLASALTGWTNGVPQGAILALTLVLAAVGVYFQYRKAPAKVKSSGDRSSSASDATSVAGTDDGTSAQESGDRTGNPS